MSFLNIYSADFHQNEALNLENEAEYLVNCRNTIKFSTQHPKLDKAFRFNRADIGFAPQRGFNRENEADGPAHCLYTIDF